MTTPTHSTAAPAVNPKITDEVLKQIKAAQSESRIVLPPNYSPESALTNAYFILKETKDKDGKQILESCTRESIANSLYKMVTFGLNPAKRQCSFVPFGNQLNLVIEYQGKIAIAKRHGVGNVIAHVIYKGEDFEYEKMAEGVKVIKHGSSLENLDGEILGAYCHVFDQEGEIVYTELMTFKQIQAAWNQGATKGASPAHKNFSDQMAKKTVINRALKTFINSSDDADLFTQQVFEEAEIIEPKAPELPLVTIPPATMPQIESEKRTEAGF